MIRKGQATLEFSLIFIIVAFLIMGLIALWKWSEQQIPDRQGAYEGTRISAGKKDTPGTPEPDGTVFQAKEPPEPNYL